jgi:hypothetical protein
MEAEGAHVGCFNVPPSSFFISGALSGSGMSQSMHRNLRPPVLTSMKLMAFPHFKQEGGGVFLAMVYSRCKRREHCQALRHR